LDGKHPRLEYFSSIWWGQQIPAYYYGEGSEDYVVAENIEEALELSQRKNNNQQLTTDNLKQDEDALDTWFSSWLWPMSVFDGMLDEKMKTLNIIIQLQIW
jgi:valyl-tRNA synthetase